jgi:hypothetical protein
MGSLLIWLKKVLIRQLFKFFWVMNPWIPPPAMFTPPISMLKRLTANTILWLSQIEIRHWEHYVNHDEMNPACQESQICEPRATKS